MKKLTREQYLDYLKMMEGRIKRATKEDHIIHGNMIYQCEDCGAFYYMNLEKGLEDPVYTAQTGHHKPVPFSFFCIECGGNAFHVMWEFTKKSLGQNYRSYQDETLRQSNKLVSRNFFWNDPDSTCGIPIIFEPDLSCIRNPASYQISKEIIEYCENDVKGVSKWIENYL